MGQSLDLLEVTDMGEINMCVDAEKPSHDRLAALFEIRRELFSYFRWEHALVVNI